MRPRKWMLAILLFMLTCALLPENAHAYSPLQCNAGQPIAGTSLYDDSNTGACRYTGLQYIFSTIICQFVTMINSIMGKLYCSIQAAVTPILMALVTLYVAIYGVQIVMGTAQLNAGEMLVRTLKFSIVFWLTTDPTFGVSAGISYMFNFFIAFVSESTRWVVKVLAQEPAIQGYLSVDTYNPGVTATFHFIDDWIHNALTGSLSSSNAKVIGFFVAMAFVMPSLAMMAVAWMISLVKMLLNTLIAFLMAIIAIAFLLALSPIFLSFLLFQITFTYFDQWLRFMISYCMQVMVSFAILTMWIFSMQLFAPFFNELSSVLFSYQRVIRPAAAIYSPADTWGLCPMTVTATPIPSIRCTNPSFNPIGPQECTPVVANAPCYEVDESGGYKKDSNGNYISVPVGTKGKTLPNQDFLKVIPPVKVTELSDFLFYLFYHLISLIIVSFGFASLQKNAQQIAKQLAGPSYTPLLNVPGLGNTSFGNVAKSGGEARKMMSKELFSAFDRRHETGRTPYEKLMEGAGNMVSKR